MKEITTDKNLIQIFLYKFDRCLEIMQGSGHDFVLSRRHTDPSPFSQQYLGY